MTREVTPYSEGLKYRRQWSFVILAWTLVIVVRLLLMTYRMRTFGLENLAEGRRAHSHGAFGLAIWHENLFASLLTHHGQPFCPMVSPSKDGEFATFVAEKLGYTPVRGSTSRRGLQALEEIDTYLERGIPTALAVDGPRGPRRIAKSGIVDIARRTGVSIIPMAAVADRYWIFSRSWDHFRVPKPFARIAIHYGPPIFVPSDTAGSAFGAIKRRVGETLTEMENCVLVDLQNWKA